MSKGIIDGIIHRLIIQNLDILKRYVSNTRGCQSGTSYRTNNAVVCCLLSVVCCLLSVVCCVEREKMSTALLSSNPLFISHTKRLQNPRDFSRTVCLLCPYWGVPGTQLS